jgi:hypothetical protein
MVEPRFPDMHEEAMASDQPYDAYALQRLEGRNDWLREHRGSSATVKAHRASQNGSTSGLHERPMVSMSGFTSIVQIPWWIPSSLTGFEIDIILRVSSRDIDAGMTDQGPELGLRAHVLGNRRDTEYGVLPRVADKGSPAEWQLKRMTYNLGDWASESKEDFFGTLSIQFKSNIEDLGSEVNSVYRSDQPDRSGVTPRPNMVKMNSDAPFGWDTAASAPEAEHWTTAAGMAITGPSVNLGPNSEWLFFYDHCTVPTYGDWDSRMHVWPYNDQLAQATGPFEGRGDISRYGLISCSYMQLHSILIREIHNAS